MKRFLSLILVLVLALSLSTMGFAADSTTVTYTGTGTESYTVTVPQSITLKDDGDATQYDVTVAGTWASNRKVSVGIDTADGKNPEQKVTVVNSIDSNDTKSLAITFAGIAKAGSNTVAIQTSDSGASAKISVENISGAIFGDWTGTVYFTCGISDVVN